MQPSRHPQQTGPRGRQWLAPIAVFMAIAINGLSNFYPPAGRNIGEISNTTLGGVLITPAGYAFAIWGLIYIGLIAYSIYQALPRQRHHPAIASISRLLTGACLFQMLWVYVFLLSRFWLSVALMFGIVACLMAAYLHTRRLPPRRAARWLVQAPISVYFGWITVAAVVNVASALLISWPGAAATGLVWTILMMAVSAGLAARVAFQYGDASFPAVAVWALSAIAIRHADLWPIALAGVGFAAGLSILIVRIVATGQGRRSPEAPRQPLQ